MMLNNNMSARLDTVDQLLRAYNGQEAGLDRAMLQEARFVFVSRVVRVFTIWVHTVIIWKNG